MKYPYKRLSVNLINSNMDIGWVCVALSLFQSYGDLGGRCLGKTDAPGEQQRIKFVSFSIKVTVKVTRSLTLVSFERVSLVQYACQIWSFYLFMWFKSYSQGWSFRYVSPTSNVTVKVTKSKLFARLEGLITGNVHMKYESSTSNGSKAMTKVKVFRNVGQRSWPRSQGHRPWFCLKGFYQLSLHMLNMKSLSLTVQKLWPRLKL